MSPDRRLNQPMCVTPHSFRDHPRGVLIHPPEYPGSGAPPPATCNPEPGFYGAYTPDDHIDEIRGAKPPYVAFEFVLAKELETLGNAVAFALADIRSVSSPGLLFSESCRVTNAPISLNLRGGIQ